MVKINKRSYLLLTIMIILMVVVVIIIDNYDTTNNDYDNSYNYTAYDKAHGGNNNIYY